MRRVSAGEALLFMHYTAVHGKALPIDAFILHFNHTSERSIDVVLEKRLKPVFPSGTDF